LVHRSSRHLHRGRKHGRTRSQSWSARPARWRPSEPPTSTEYAQYPSRSIECLSVPGDHW